MWNYRLCKSTFTYQDGSTETEMGIYEVYYNAKGEITMHTEKTVGVFGNSEDEIRSVLNKMSESLNKEIIDLDTLVFAKSDTPE